VVKDGIINTLTAAVTSPIGLAPTSGKPYIADGFRILGPNRKDQLVTVVGSAVYAGTSGDGGPAHKALLTTPYGLATDAAGDLFIGDAARSSVREVSAATGKINRIAGTGTWGSTGDGGPSAQAEIGTPDGLAVDPSGTVLYIADYGAGNVRRVDLTTGTISTYVGTTGAYANYAPNLTPAQLPTGRVQAVVLDAAGNLYVPVFFNDRGNMIMRIGTDGSVTPVVGGGSSTVAGVAGADFNLGTVTGLAIDPATGDLYIASNGAIYVMRGVAQGG